MYQCEAVSIEGFIQQLAVSYIRNGYWFYVTGQVPERKEPQAVDQKLIQRYEVGVSKWVRARRKRAGLANVHYLRRGRFFVLLATHGKHSFFQEEARIRDVRRTSVKFAGYSVGCGKGRDGRWHPSVRIAQEAFRLLKRRFLELALRHSGEELAAQFRTLPFEPYAPVRDQLRIVLRAVNRVRKAAGQEKVGPCALRAKRKAIRVFAKQASG